MKHVYMTEASSNYRTEWEDNQGVVHYDGPGLIGSATLCGYTDLVGCSWADTTKRVNCSGCLATRDHVTGKTRVRG